VKKLIAKPQSAAMLLVSAIINDKPEVAYLYLRVATVPQ